MGVGKLVERAACRWEQLACAFLTRHGVAIPICPTDEAMDDPMDMFAGAEEEEEEGDEKEEEGRLSEEQEGEKMRSIDHGNIIFIFIKI